jgi:hypothetical protein
VDWRRGDAAGASAVSAWGRRWGGDLVGAGMRVPAFREKRSGSSDQLGAELGRRTTCGLRRTSYVVRRTLRSHGYPRTSSLDRGFEDGGDLMRSPLF